MILPAILGTTSIFSLFFPVGREKLLRRAPGGAANSLCQCDGVEVVEEGGDAAGV
jgi:hypothetical protein